jgi:pimeloyl-ACP methyl ester carboxylesterase
MIYEGLFIEVNGIKMFYEDHGTGKPLILLHGGLMNAKLNWEKQIPIFSEYFRVISPDTRGHRKSNNPSGEFSYRLISDDIGALIKALDLGRTLVCGFSDGGQTAFELGLRYPELVEAIASGGVVHELSENYEDEFKAYLGTTAPGVIDFNYIKKIDWYSEGVKFLREIHSPGPDYWKSLMKSLSKVWLNPQEYPGNRIQELNMPVLILIGDRDQINSVETSIKMFRLIANAELAVVPNTAHVWVELFSELALDFFLRHTSIPKKPSA